MIKSYWLRILTCGIAAAIAGFIISMITPKQYDAVLQVLVAPYSPNAGVAGGNEAEDSVRDILQASAPRSVQTQVQMLMSNDVIQTAASKVGDDLNLPYKNPGDELFPFDLQDKISISAEKESDIVTMRVRMSKPEVAQRIAKEMYLAFEDKNIRLSQDSANRAISFLQKQNNTIQNQLGAIETASAQAKQEAHSANIDYTIQTEIAQLKDFQSQLESAKADEVASDARSSAIRGQMVGVPRTTPGASASSENPRYLHIEQNLLDAQSARTRLLQTYLPDSDPVKGWDRVIDDAEKELAKTPKYAKSSDTQTPNPAYQQLDLDYRGSLAMVKAAESRRKSLESAVDKTRTDLDRLPAIQQKLSDLERQKDVLVRISDLYTSKLKTLEFAGSGRVSATKLVTLAQVNPRPSVPNTSLNVGLGFFLGLAIGFLWSIGTEAKRNPIRSLGQLNRLALQPCYRVIPELRVPMRGLSRAPAEVFDSLLVNFIRSEKKGYRLGVLGVTRGAGASTTAMNLAVAAARGGKTVLYVEVDPGNSALTKLTPAAGDIRSPGANISIYNASLGETLSGGTIGLPSDLEVAAQGKDLIIFDFSPVKVSGDAFLLANQLDEMILLVRANLTKSVDFLQSQQALIDTGCPLVTVTLSRVQDQSDDVSALEQQADSRAITPQA